MVVLIRNIELQLQKVVEKLLAAVGFFNKKRRFWIFSRLSNIS